MKASAEQFVENHFIERILNGELKPFEKMKPERVLAEELGYSRPVIHKAIMRLEDKGLVKIKPRKGVEVLDYKTHGKLSLLDNILFLDKDDISNDLNKAMITFIKDNFRSIIITFRVVTKQATVLDLKTLEGYFNWLHSYAVLSENLIYPMLINAFEIGIKNVSKTLVGDPCIEEMIFKIENFLVNGEIEAALSYVEPLFEKIQKNWIGG